MSAPNPLLFAHSTTSSIPHSSGSPGTPAAPSPVVDMDDGLLDELLVGLAGLAPPSITDAGEGVPVPAPSC